MKEEKALESESSEVKIWLCVLWAMWPLLVIMLSHMVIVKNKMKWHGETDWALESE